MACRGIAGFVAVTPSLGTDGDFVPPMMSGANGSGCDVDCVDLAGRLSQSCPTGWLRLRTTRCAVASRRVSGSVPEIRWSEQRRAAKIPCVCLILRRYAAGCNGDCSACGAGSKAAQRVNTFVALLAYRMPPRLV